MALTQEQRDKLNSSEFAVPKKRALPIPDAEHVKLAHDVVDRTEGLTDKERQKARKRIKRKARELGIDISGWQADSLGRNITLQAMALNIPDTPGHPNKHPFKGVLTRIGEPSDAPPSGAPKRVILTRAAAEDALPTLLGMPVDAKSNMSGHDVRSKIGTITAATIEGNAIHIEGFLYAADFPEEVRQIQSERDSLGFSWEIRDIFVEDVHADPLTITGCIFTGAAILYKDKAAYTSTSLAAEAEEIFMTKEVLEAVAALGEQLKKSNEELTGRIDKIEASQTESAKKQDQTLQEMQAGKEHLAKMEPHAAALESCAAGLKAAGVGGHPVRGHVAACEAMADHLRASAAMGKVPDSWPGFEGFRASAEDKGDDAAVKKLTGQIESLQAEMKASKDREASLNTKIEDMKAAAAKTTTPPERKTLSPTLTHLMAKAGITLPTNGEKMSVSNVNAALAKCNLDTEQRIEVKANLAKIGVLEAA